MLNEMLKKLAFEVVYLSKESEEFREREEELDCARMYARMQEARHIMCMMFGTETTTEAIIKAREKCKSLTAYEIWRDYIYQENM